ncbi:MAG TPA: porin family protein [Bacteroidia bacterium]
MRKILISVALIASTGCLVAQDEPKKVKTTDERNKMHPGIKIGFNNSNVYDEEGDEFSTEPKYGFAGGVFLSVPLGKYLGIQPGALVSQKGFHATGKLLENSYDLSRTTTHLDVPVLVEFKPIRALTLLGGPQYSYLLARTDVFRNNTSAFIQQQEFKNDDIRKNVLSAALGFDLNIKRFVFSGRYNFDLQQNHSDGSANTPRYKNIWLQATIGVRY